MGTTPPHTVCADLVLRPLGPQDEERVRALHEHLTERETYLRFFTLVPRHLDDLVDMLCNQDDKHVSLGAFDDGTLVGVANYTVLEPDHKAPTAECAVAVGHPFQHHGVGTTLLQRLVGIAWRRGIRHLSAFVLAENSTMLQVLEDLGWSRDERAPGPVVEVKIDLADPRGEDDLRNLIAGPAG
ncbi:GNAT family N-acetyltransferase [Rhodococcus sp. As11]|uniref:GNAT family N-acetyltransferase n=1 Tax=Rhodococcus sp. As11 TaxID=3029189 RepID=UPI003B7D830A